MTSPRLADPKSGSPLPSAALTKDFGRSFEDDDVASMGKRKSHISTGFTEVNRRLNWPSADQIERIEHALASSISPQGWAEIVHATAFTIMNEGSNQFKPTREFLQLLQRIVDDLEKLTAELQDLPFSDVGPKWIIPVGGKMTRVPVSEGRKGLIDIVERHFQLEVPEGEYEDELSVYSMLDWAVEGMLVTTKVAIREISRSDYLQYRTGDLWDAWIYVLTVIMREHGLPYKVGKRNAEENRFVKFVYELQRECIPEQYRRHHHSKDALATAIVRARFGKSFAGKQFKEIFPIAAVTGISRNSK
jgi:hypothetical protein